MVYCDECGKQNEEDAEYCSKCGHPLKGDRHRRRSKDYRHRQREECFGLPHGNLIVPLIIGIILILWGISSIYGFAIWNYMWPIIVIIVGIIILIAVIYGFRRKD